MVRVGKKKGGGGRKSTKQYDPVNSDNENDHYDDSFDPNNPFDDDEVEKFHNDRDKILLNGHTRGGKNAFVDSSEDEEEVLAFDDDDSDDDSHLGQIEEEEDEDKSAGKEEDDKMAGSSWGSKKSAYYSANRIKNDEDAELEEEEARLLQAKMLKELDSNDFGLDAFQATERPLMKTSDELSAQKLAETHFKLDPDDDESVRKVIKNLSKMSKKEKLDFLKQESPELFELVRDFREKIEILEKKLLPIYAYIKQGHAGQPQPASTMASEYVVNKTKLYLMYCAHLSFYFILKSRRVTIENHPIVKNILQYRNLCKQIEKIDARLDAELNLILKSLESGQALSFRKKATSEQQKSKKSVRFREAAAAAAAKKKSMEFDDGLEDDGGENEEEEEGEKGATTSAKRAINYEIEKNKGLTPKRPKSYRNPRVRNRLKARKAHIKHKSIVPKLRSQDKRYSGEATGIRTSVVRAVKFK